MKINKYYIAALTYSIFVGLSFLVTKLVVPHAPSELILSHRFTISLIGYSIFILLSGQKIKLTKKKLLAILPITLFYPLLFFTFQIYGLTYATSSEAGIIFAMVPILVILIGLLMGNYPSRTQLLCIMMSVSGVMIIFTRNLSSLNGNSSGLTLLFLSALSSAVYTILVKKVLKQVTVHELTFVITLIGFLVFNLMFIVGNNHASEVITQYLAPFNNQSYSIGILYLGLFASIGASFSSNYAIQNLSAPQFSVFSNLSTLISIIAGAVILNEPLSLQHYIGSTLILIGVLGTNLSQYIENRFILALKKTY